MYTKLFHYIIAGRIEDTYMLIEKPQAKRPAPAVLVYKATEPSKLHHCCPKKDSFGADCLWLTKALTSNVIKFVRFLLFYVNINVYLDNLKV